MISSWQQLIASDGYGNIEGLLDHGILEEVIMTFRELPPEPQVLCLDFILRAPILSSLSDH